MRRKDREQTEEFGWDVLERCAYGVLSLVTPEGEPYAIPISPAVHDGAVYFHSAKHGQKSKIMAANPAACLVCVADDAPLPEEYAMLYASVVVKGTVALVEDEAERIAGLRAIVAHYAPDHGAKFDEAVADEGPRTAVWRITPSEVTAKARLA